MKPTLILCPIDFSEPSRAALEEAVLVAREADAKLLLVHVARQIVPPADVPALLPEVVQRATEGFEAQLAGWRRDALELGAREVETRILHGAPWDAIVTAARDLHCELIVIGTHGRTGLSHVLHGSVAEKVARHAPCSVLVARHAAQAAPSPTA